MAGFLRLEGVAHTHTDGHLNATASNYRVKIRLAVPSSPKAISKRTGIPYIVVCKILARLERAGAVALLEFADPPYSHPAAMPTGARRHSGRSPDGKLGSPCVGSKSCIRT